MKIDLSSQVKISADVLFQEISGETVLLDLKSESYFGLDNTGTRIWQILQEETEIQKLFERMAAEYEVEPNELKSDLIGHLDRLYAAGLIHLVGQDQ